MHSLLKFLSENWVVLAGLAAGIAFVFERTFNVIADRKRKKQVYNRCLLELVKLHMAYLRQKGLLFNRLMGLMPIDNLHNSITRGNNLQEQMVAFNAFVAKEAELVPELIIQSFYVTNMIERLFAPERIYKPDELDSEKLKSIYDQQRAIINSDIGQFISSGLYDMIVKVAEKSSLAPSKQKVLADILSPAREAENQKADNEIIGRLFDEMHRQGSLTDEQYEALKTVM